MPLSKKHLYILKQASEKQGPIARNHFVDACKAAGASVERVSDRLTLSFGQTSLALHRGDIEFGQYDNADRVISGFAKTLLENPSQP